MKLIIPESVGKLKEVKLTHPKTGERVSFLISEEGHLYEHRVHQPNIGSFFIGDSVDSDSSLVFVTRVDELFLLIPFLRKCQKQFRSLEDILSEETDLLQLECVEFLHLITDFKEVDGTKYYRYSQEKVVGWLKKKLEAVSKIVLDKKLSYSSNCSGLVNVSGSRTPAEDVDLKRYSLRLINDYLPDEIYQEVLKSWGLESREVETLQIEVKRQSSGKGKPSEDYYKSPGKDSSNVKKVLTRAQKDLLKVDKTGMKSLNSYFSKTK